MGVVEEGTVYSFRRIRHALKEHNRDFVRLTKDGPVDGACGYRGAECLQGFSFEIRELKT
jgi:hypothetical protein